MSAVRRAGQGILAEENTEKREEIIELGRVPVPVEEEVELIAALEAGKRSLQLGREVTIAEVMEGLSE